MTTIPYDVYESPYEIAIIVPFWWVKKESINIKIRHETIYITGERKKLELREDFEIIQHKCFRGHIELSIDLPPNSNYKNMTSNLSKENILTIIIPKNIIPDHIKVFIEE